MIPPLQYQKLTLLQQLLQGGQQVFRLYEGRDFGFEQGLSQWLQQCDQFFEQHNGAVERSKMKALHADLSTLQKGIDPYSFQRIESRRREAQLTLGYRISRDAMDMITRYYDTLEQKLKSVYDTIGQMLLMAMQAGVVPEAAIEAALEKGFADGIWHMMGQDAQLQLLQKKVLLQVSSYDARLILLDALRAMHPAKA